MALRMPRLRSRTEEPPLGGASVGSRPPEAHGVSPSAVTSWPSRGGSNPGFGVRTAGVGDPAPSGVDRPPPGPPPGHSPPPADPSPSVARGRARRPSWLAWTALALVAVLATAALWRTFGIPRYTDAQARAVASAAVDQARRQDASRPPEAEAAYAAIAPSMVVIRTRGGAEDGLGAGFIANADGRILTANHVVSGGGTIEVIFADGTHSDATVKEAHPETDTAVLTPATLPSVVTPAVLAGGGRIGDPVYAVGHPLGLTFSLSAGVISGLDRAIEVPGRELKGLIQFDAAVNPGNSGGPLLNGAGQVVGIVTALANPSKQAFFVGIGFAVPISQAGGAAGAPPL